MYRLRIDHPKQTSWLSSCHLKCISYFKHHIRLPMCVIIYNSLSSRASVAHPWAPEPQELQVLHPLAVILLLYTAWTTKAWRLHLKHNQPFYLIPGHRFWTCCHLVYHQVTILNSHKLFYEMFANRTARFYIGAIFTIQPVSITLTI